MTTKDLICFNCKHWREDAPGCDAFPDGIPNEILEKNEHAEPLEGQGNDLVYTPRENGL